MLLSFSRCQTGIWILAVKEWQLKRSPLTSFIFSRNNWFGLVWFALLSGSDRNPRKDNARIIISIV